MKYEIKQTPTFVKWLSKIKDSQAKKAILMRLVRAANGNLGDIKSVGGPICEMRIFIGKGYRVYFTLRDSELVILLCGGDKSTQQNDITNANKMFNELEI